MFYHDNWCLYFNTFIISTVTTELSIIISGLLVPSLIIILKLAPIVHKNNPIWEEALYRHRQYSIIISILIACAVIVFVLVKQYTLSLVLSLGIFQVSISLLVEKLKEVKHNEDQNLMFKVSSIVCSLHFSCHSIFGSNVRRNILSAQGPQKP